MIGKQIKGRDFSGCLAYVLGKPGARLIGGNMEGTTPQELTIEFEQIRQRNERIQRPVYHCALSLSPGESFTDDTWRDISAKYLKAMGFSRNQYVLVRHTDTEHHEHVHIVANRVRRNGEAVTDSWDFRRSEAILRQLEQEYALTSVVPTWERDRSSPTRRELEQERKTTKPSVRKRLQQLIDRALSDDHLVTNLEQLTDRLAESGVSVRLRQNQKTQLQGISFELDGIAIAGSKLGRAYSLARIEQRLSGRTSSEPQFQSEAARVRKLIHQQVKQVQSLPELVEQLNQAGIKAQLHIPQQGQRLMVEVDGKFISSSRLGKLYGTKALVAQLGQPSETPIRSQPVQNHSLPKVSAEAHQMMLIHEWLRQQIDAVQNVSQSLPEFVNGLAEAGIRATIRYTRHQKPQGISFSLDGVTIAGSRLGAEYSLQKLLVRLERSQSSPPPSPIRVDEQESIYERLYQHVSQQIQKRDKRQKPQDEVDLAIAQYILSNGKEADIRALVYSPQIQEIKRSSGREQAEMYLQELLQKAIQSLEPEEHNRFTRSQISILRSSGFDRSS
ncbi:MULTISPECIES: relaxase/mobilization nuclease domain-containing protein [Leptolyngbya]|uniref:relaxase/mobilization nuclease domain-containing protein n=1 Tax=Leptolyngbya TaxID=47251 RepID=UPI0016892F47|nr:relaxase/mobilization nuclease domain-containing protein [Leptolyngbya sp. FACHB-1624]MBD1854781.1 relaxase/mobilization nuclease domain-containing protein [Leptolyngbya sp. FACHB-1624]